MATYSFNDVVASIAGPTGMISLGYGNAVADEGISVDMAGDKNTMTIGADGSVMHSLHADRSGHVTLRLLKTSPQNSLLQAMYDAQTASAALHGTNTITVSHAVSGDITTASTCAFKKKPNIKYSKDGDVLEWQWDAGKITTVLGTY
jgi:hypothetical protein